MTPQERELLTNLIGRLRQAPAQAKDPEADQLIADLVRERPDVAYVLAQTVLIQDYSLHQAQARIAELANQPPAANAGAGSFLGGLFGHGFGGLGGFGGQAFAAQPSITETVINNFPAGDAGQLAGDPGGALDPGGLTGDQPIPDFTPATGDLADNSFDSGFDSGGDFGGTDV